ncbi:sel1 repeat family protein [Providencia vermicola]|uniref:sel1 repeat family protein n=1 Tax=Providencia vermicola TaxID=333965 RepID=UPI0034D6D657
MTKRVKIVLIVFIAIFVISGLHLIQKKATHSAQMGYQLYYDGNFASAFKYFNQRAHSDPQSAFSLAMMYWNGIGTAQNKPLAIEWLIKSADQNNPSALYNLGYFRYYKQIADTPNDLYGLTSLNKAADLGVLNAQELLGIIYLDNQHTQIKKDYELARYYFTRASQQGSRLAKYGSAGIAYQYDKDYQKAVSLLEPLIKDNFAIAALLLSHIYREGGYGIEKNIQLADKYEQSIQDAMQYFDFNQLYLEAAPLSVQGYLTPKEQNRQRQQLEQRAAEGDDSAYYTLFERFYSGDGFHKDLLKAIEYLQPLIEKKSPKALYLHYVMTKSEPQYLIDAANANYPDAVFQLYQIYSGHIHDIHFKTNRELADKYLAISADLGNLDAILDLINHSLNHYHFPNKELNAIVTKYTLEGLNQFPSSAEMLITASGVYGNKRTDLYDPKISFELNAKARDYSSEPDIINQLADKYANAIGTQKDLTKAVALFKQSLTLKPEKNIASIKLVQLYYDEQPVNGLDEQFILSLLKEDANPPYLSKLGYYYADYLLQQDPQKNHALAFQLYEVTSKYSGKAALHYANALFKYQTGQEEAALKQVINAFEYHKYDRSLNEKELHDAYALLFNYGMHHPKAQELVIAFALNEHNAEATALVESLVGKDAHITYLYAINHLAKIQDISSATESELKTYFNLLLQASDLGSIDATIYIIHNLDDINYQNSQPYNKTKFMSLTGLTQKDLVTWYQKCADLGNNTCLFKLGEIYQKGLYGINPDYEKAISYYFSIKTPANSHMASQLKRIKTDHRDFTQLLEKANHGDSDALYKLANAYKKGQYGQNPNQQIWLKYLAASAQRDHQQALIDSIHFYTKNDLIEKNQNKVLGYYQQLIQLGNQEYADKLAKQYLTGSKLVNIDRSKARKYYQAAGEIGDYDIKLMDNFDIYLNVIDDSLLAKYELANAYLYGFGTKRDIEKAVYYFEQAANENHEQAINQYISLLQNGYYDHEEKKWLLLPNWQDAIIWLNKYPNSEHAADSIKFFNTTVSPALNGDTKAYFNIANWYQDNMQSQAAQIWYRKSVDAGDVRAIPYLDKLLERDDYETKYQLYQQGAEKGDIYSQVQLAWFDLNNAEIKTYSEQYQTAIKYLNQGLKSSDTQISQSAFDYLSTLYHQGISDKNNQQLHPSDNQRYLALLEDEAAQRNQALIQLYDYYNKRDPEKALGYLKMAYEKGYPTAMEYLYQASFSNENCQNKRFDENAATLYLTQWLEKSHFSGNDYYHTDSPSALINKLGDVYFYGNCGVKKDLDTAIKWYETSLEYRGHQAINKLYDAYLEKGDAKKVYYYGLMAGKNIPEIKLLNTLSDTEREAVKAEYEHQQNEQQYGDYRDEIIDKQQKAETGDASAAYSLAIIYSRGTQAPFDPVKVVYYYELSGKNSNADAYNALGHLYLNEDDLNFPKDVQKALYYFDLGAKLNDSNTAHLAGDLLYFERDGIETDYARAAQYYAMTDLEQGIHHALAKYKLAELYYHGLVGSKSKEDQQKAYDYLQLAAKYKVPHAIKALEEWDFKQINK